MAAAKIGIQLIANLCFGRVDGRMVFLIDMRPSLSIYMDKHRGRRDTCFAQFVLREEMTGEVEHSARVVSPELRRGRGDYRWAKVTKAFRCID